LVRVVYDGDTREGNTKKAPLLDYYTSIIASTGLGSTLASGPGHQRFANRPYHFRDYLHRTRRQSSYDDDEAPTLAVTTSRRRTQHHSSVYCKSGVPLILACTTRRSYSKGLVLRNGDKRISSLPLPSSSPTRLHKRMRKASALVVSLASLLPFPPCPYSGNPRYYCQLGACRYMVLPRES
jgi:hypothetical protein